MKGFTKDVLILLPKHDSFNGKDAYWKMNLNKSVLKAIEFVEKVMQAKPCMISSNEIAVELFGTHPYVTWWNALPPEDCNFAKRNCEGLSSLPSGIDFDDEYEIARSKYPIKGFLAASDRFAVAAKREKLIANKLVKNCKVVISFENQSNAAYKVEKDLVVDRAVFLVSPTDFKIRTYYIGQPIDTVGFTQEPYTTMPLYLWEVN